MQVGVKRTHSTCIVMNHHETIPPPPPPPVPTSSISSSPSLSYPLNQQLLVNHHNQTHSSYSNYYSPSYNNNNNNNNHNHSFFPSSSQPMSLPNPYPVNSSQFNAHHPPISHHRQNHHQHQHQHQHHHHHRQHKHHQNQANHFDLNSIINGMLPLPPKPKQPLDIINTKISLKTKSKKKKQKRKSEMNKLPPIEIEYEYDTDENNEGGYLSNHNQHIHKNDRYLYQINGLYINHKKRKKTKTKHKKRKSHSMENKSDPDQVVIIIDDPHKHNKRRDKNKKHYKRKSKSKSPRSPNLKKLSKLKPKPEHQNINKSMDLTDDQLSHAVVHEMLCQMQQEMLCHFNKSRDDGYVETNPYETHEHKKNLSIKHQNSHNNNDEEKEEEEVETVDTESIRKPLFGPNISNIANISYTTSDEDVMNNLTYNDTQISISPKSLTHQESVVISEMQYEQNDVVSVASDDIVFNNKPETNGGNIGNTRNTAKINVNADNDSNKHEDDNDKSAEHISSSSSSSFISSHKSLSRFISNLHDKRKKNKNAHPQITINNDIKDSKNKNKNDKHLEHERIASYSSSVTGRVQHYYEEEELDIFQIASHQSNVSVHNNDILDLNDSGLDEDDYNVHDNHHHEKKKTDNLVFQRTKLPTKYGKSHRKKGFPPSPIMPPIVEERQTLIVNIDNIDSTLPSPTKSMEDKDRTAAMSPDTPLTPLTPITPTTPLTPIYDIQSIATSTCTNHPILRTPNTKNHEKSRSKSLSNLSLPTILNVQPLENMMGKRAESLVIDTSIIQQRQPQPQHPSNSLYHRHQQPDISKVQKQAEVNKHEDITEHDADDDDDEDDEDEDDVDSDDTDEYQKEEDEIESPLAFQRSSTFTQTKVRRIKSTESHEHHHQHHHHHHKRKRSSVQSALLKHSQTSPIKLSVDIGINLNKFQQKAKVEGGTKKKKLKRDRKKRREKREKIKRDKRGKRESVEYRARFSLHSLPRDIDKLTKQTQTESKCHLQHKSSYSPQIDQIEQEKRKRKRKKKQKSAENLSTAFVNARKSLPYYMPSNHQVNINKRYVPPSNQKHNHFNFRYNNNKIPPPPKRYSYNGKLIDII